MRNYPSCNNKASALIAMVEEARNLQKKQRREFVRETPGVNFELATINPVMVYGPPISGSAHLKNLGQSLGETYQLMNNSPEEVPPTRMPVFVDVQDVALAHRLAYETKEPGRFLMCEGHYTYAGVCQLLCKELPAIEDRIPQVTQEDVDGVPHYSVDTTRAKMILGIKFRPFEQTFGDRQMPFWRWKYRSAFDFWRTGFVYPENAIIAFIGLVRVCRKP